MTTDRDPISTALERCATEPVHAPGSVQPAGVVLVTDAGLGRIEQASVNAAQLLGRSARDLAGADLAAAIGEAGAAALRRAAAASVDEEAGIEIPDPTGQGVVQVTLHRRLEDEVAVVELEPSPHTDASLRALVRAFEAETRSVACEETETGVCEALAAGVRALTGHERGLVYRFDESFNGRVVSESRTDAMSSYRGLRFPASDIPPPVRSLYRERAVRLIVDAAAEPVPLEPPRAADVDPVDLRRAVFRSVSPIHVEYLRNMGVRSALSVAIDGRDDLWGLVACHGPEPRFVSAEARHAVAALARIASQRIRYLNERGKTRYREWIHQLRLDLAEAAKSVASAREMIEGRSESLLRAFDASGAAFVQGGSRTSIGRCPPDELITRILEHLAESEVASPYATEALPETLPAAAGHESVACGLLAASLSFRTSRDWLLLFRPEEPEIAVWAGDPNKPVEGEGAGERLSPRQSFRAWREERRGRSAAWSSAEIRAGRDIAHDMAVIASEVEIRQLNERLQADQESLARANVDLAYQAAVDALTGAGSREWIERLVRQRIEGRRKTEERFSVLVIDVDYFKALNDAHGHAAGDRALQALVATLGDQLRDGDLLGRWGGEEFVVLASDASETEAEVLAERLRRGVAESEDPDLAGLTISIGVAGFQGERKVGELIRRADEALYAAKDAGRNTVRLASS